MAAKTWESDFRFAAINASLKKLEGESPDSFFDLRESFCLPVSQRPAVGLTPGKVTLVALLLGFALLGAGVWIGSLAELEANKQHSTVILTMAALSSLSGILMFFLPTLFDRQLVRLFLRERGRKLMERSGSGTLLSAEVSEADKSEIKLAIDGDDQVLVWADTSARRLVVEGIAARYQVCAEDVLWVRSFEWMNYVGARIAFRIDDETVLELALARVSYFYELANQLPFLWFLRKCFTNKLLLEATDAVGEKR